MGSSKMAKKHRKLYQEKSSKFSLLPIAFTIFVIPLLVYMKVVELTDIEIENWLGGEVHPDFFNAIKVQWLMIGTILAIVFFLVYFIIKRFEFKKSFAYIPIVTYAILIVLSTITSDYPEVALNGFVGRYEGMWVLLSYLALFVITFNLVKDESQIKFLLGALLISATIVALIGTFQFFNMDIFRTDFGKKLILPEAYHEYREGLEFVFEDSNVYATLSNPNYVGSYVALLLPIAFVALLNFKKIYMKIGAGLLMIILLITLYGSKSSAGIVGVIFSAILALIIFRKAIFKRKVLSISIVVVLIVGFFGANFATGGIVTDKIQSKVKNAIGVDSPFFDLQDIIFEDNTVSIVSGTETLVIEIDEEGKLQYYDSFHNTLKPLIYNREEDYVVNFSDEAYKNAYRYLIIEDSLIKIYPQYAFFQIYAMPDNTFKLVGIKGELVDRIKKPETIGFTNKERIGSARGYIWSRTFPLLKNSLIWGCGPDSFAIEFPQDDYIGKIRGFYDGTNMVVDKPHNMYLQVATNTGVLSLLAFLVLAGFYVVQSLSTYIHINKKNHTALFGAGIFLAICGYLVASFFNDSVVGVAPVFWVLLGIGFVCNQLVRSNKIVRRNQNNTHDCIKQDARMI